MTDHKGIWVFDVEADGLNPSKIYCLAACSPQGSEIFCTNNYDNMRKFLLNAKVLIGHNIKRWDIPHLERLLGIKITARIVDTLAVSWYLNPSKIFRHGLDEWGERVGIKKPEISDWFTLSQEEYEHRCKEDVRINVKIWNLMYQKLYAIYGADKGVWKLLDYLTFKLHCAMLQEKSQWKLDIDRAKQSLNELTKIQEEKVEELAEIMPKVLKYDTKTKPKKFINKDGTYSKLGMDWIALCTEHGHPPTYDGEIQVLKGEERGNPNSTIQLKAWLDSLGWEPETFKEVKNKVTGDIRNVPQINRENGKGICPSIKLLYKKEPNLEMLDGLSVLEHRIGILKGFLVNHENGWLKAQVSGVTNTLRFKHTTIVNLPKPDKRYAEPIRSSLIADDGFVLCGSDMSSLEDRIKQHYIYPLDPDYVKEMTVDGFDPHLDLALSASAVTIEQVLRYKDGTDKSIDPIRHIYKTGNYSLQYGTGVPKLSRSTGLSIKEAKKVYEAYWKRNWAVKKVATTQRTKEIDGQMWLFNPVSKLWYSLRFEKDIFSTLVQGTASYVFDRWVQIILEEREQITGQMHDEFILHIREGNEEKCTDLVDRAMKKLNTELKLNRELSYGIAYGKRYSDIH